MRCYICDKVLTEPTYNRDYKSYDPCKECLEVIQDTIGAFTDRPSADDSELGDESPTEITFYLTQLAHRGTLEI